ncbi:hypothetical protein F4778DRAFT_13223 [Xylariomycetidae sp. FL2044]|nr:hypothetical protein F4778DRAFT_13223 [Xylariomycetidae sp. FL2044]
MSMVCTRKRGRQTSDVTNDIQASSQPTKHCKMSHTDFGSTILDDDGDLFLAVGAGIGDQTTFKVCSKTLSRASPAWRALFYGGFSEAHRPEGRDWTVELPEDKPSAMLIVLNIIHSHFDKVPSSESMSVDTLYDITVLTDKYALTACLLPWAREWMKKVNTDCSPLEVLGIPVVRRLLWIAWELGAQDTFKKLLPYLAWSSGKRADSELTIAEEQQEQQEQQEPQEPQEPQESPESPESPESQESPEPQEPPASLFGADMEPTEILDIIAAVRGSYLESLLEDFMSLRSSYMSSTRDPATSDMRLGAMMREFTR